LSFLRKFPVYFSPVKTRCNGPGNGNDYPVGMYIDNNGAAYITGITQGTITGKDIATVKFNSSGTQVWSTVYDYTGHDDYATGICSNSGGNIYVSGGSATSSTSRAFTVIKYKASNGTQLNINRTNTIGGGPSLDIASAINSGTGSDKSVYATGVMSSNGVNFFAYTAKYDSSLNRKWSDTLREDSIYTEARILKLDKVNNLYVGGYEKDHGPRNTWFITKYDSNGHHNWVQNYYGNYQNMDSSELVGMYVDAGANVLAIGNIHNGSNKHVAMAQYDSSGRIQWDNIFQPTGQMVTANAVIKDSNSNIYSTAIEQNGTTLKYVVRKHEIFVYTDTVKNDTASNPWYLKHQIIVNFDPDIVDTTPVNDVDTTYGTVANFIPTAYIDTINTKLGLSGDGIGAFIAVKIYRKMNTHTTFIIGRTGDSVRVPQFWSCLLVQLPTSLNETATADSLEKLDFIIHSELNYLLQLATFPNDSNYATKQLSLHPNGTYTDADINIDPVFNTYNITGNSDIKIGDFDSGILWNHADFGGKASSKVTGFDYVNNVRINNANSKDSTGHGTATAGIYGASTNNQKGVAGITGGNGTTTGCGLVAMKISTGTSNTMSVSDFCNAMGDGLNSTSNGGYGLNVINVSALTYNPSFLLDTNCMYAYNTDAVLVAAMGNDGKNFVATTPAYPAGCPDNWVVAVGASSIDGKYSNEQIVSGVQSDLFKSNYGQGYVDLIAPGDDHMVYSTSNTSTNAYAKFSGTSASSAHVSGVAGSILSYYDGYFGTGTNLTADDVQYVLKHSANHSGMGISSFPDSKAGWGRLDGTGALDFLEKSKYNIKHVIHTPSQPKPVATKVHGLVTRVLDNSFNILPASSYTVDVWKVTFKIPYTINAHATVLNCWPRNNAYYVEKTLLTEDGYGDIIEQPSIHVDSFTNTGAYISGYIYYAYDDIYTHTSYNRWFPFDTSATSLKNLGAAISIRTNEPSTSAVFVPKDNNAIYHVIFPDPAHNTIAMKYTIPDEATVSITITDIEGRVLSNSIYNRVPAGDNRVDFDIKGYTPGVYLMRLKINNDQYYDKFIKN